MDYDAVIELGEVTLGECLDLYEKKNIYSIINDGHIKDFVKE